MIRCVFLLIYTDLLPLLAIFFGASACKAVEKWLAHEAQEGPTVDSHRQANRRKHGLFVHREKKGYSDEVV